MAWRGRWSACWVNHRVLIIECSIHWIYSIDLGVRLHQRRVAPPGGVIRNVSAMINTPGGKLWTMVSEVVAPPADGFETCAHRGRRNACVTERISIATADGRLQLHAAGHQQLPKRHLFILAPNTRQRRCMPSSSPAHYAKAGLGSSRLLLPCFPRLPLVRLFR